MKKSTLLMIVSVVLAMTLSLGSTLAYLQDSDSDVNVMTLGSVYIEQIEQQRVMGADGKFTTQLEPYEQGKVLMPYVTGTEYEGAVTVGEYTFEAETEKNNFVDKIVSVKNTGKSDAYVRTLVAVPTGGDDWAEIGSASDNWLHWNYKAAALEHWTLNSTPAEIVIDGRDYFVWEFVHKNALAPNAQTYPSVVGFYMDKRVNVDENSFFITYEDNTTKRIDFTPDDTVDILVVSQGVQTAGFASATEALTAGFGAFNDENAAKWFQGLTPVDYTADAAAFEAALANGGTVVLANDVELTSDDTDIADPTTLDLAGHTLSASRTASTAADSVVLNVQANTVITGNGTVKNPIDYAINVEKGATLTIKNGSYEGVISAVQVSEGTLVIEGGTFEVGESNYGSTFLLNCKDDPYKDGTAKIIVKGGSFKGFNPADNEAEPGDHINFLADGYTVKQYGDWYVVTEADETEIPVENPDVLDDALNNAEGDYVVLDCKGADMGSLDAALTKTNVPAGKTLVIKNAVFSEKSYGNGMNGTVIFENCTFNRADGAYSIHFDNGDKATNSVTFKNCTLAGWCSFGSAIGSVTMEGCTIKGNGMYAMNRFYQKTTMTNCVIDCSNTDTTDAYPDGISAVNGATVTLTNCTIKSAEYEVDGGAKIIVGGETVAEDVVADNQ